MHRSPRVVNDGLGPVLKHKPFSGNSDRASLERKRELAEKLKRGMPSLPFAYGNRRRNVVLTSSFSSSTGVSCSKTRWYCQLCQKSLCSKRSFTEHVNTHTRSRPFACTQCHYAAASQMTLRRHILRNHTSRKDWGYHCPYCPDAFMEPASYQHHITTKHFGRSATFGCQERGCDFRTRCAKHLHFHLMRHSESEESEQQLIGKCRDHRRHSGSSFPPANRWNLNRYLVDDELGEGFGKEPLKVPTCPPKTKQWIPVDFSQRFHWKSEKVQPSNEEDEFVDVDGYGSEEDSLKMNMIGANLVLPNQSIVILPEEEELSVEQEVVVDGTEEGLKRAAQPEIQKLPDGQVDFDLD